MKRALSVCIVVLMAALPLGMAQDDAWSTRDAATPAFRNYEVPGADSAPEPTIGIPWNTDDVFYHAYATTVRGSFDADHHATWDDVTPLHQLPANVDPMLHADPDTGRIYAGGLVGPCSYMAISDDNGETWTQAGNMCSGARFDHQSIGSGPHDLLSEPPFDQNAAYYCGQLDAIACAASYDGGQSWGPFQDVPGPCGGFHGHIRVSRTTGMVAVPVASCSDEHGFISTSDFGLTWRSHAIPDSGEWTNGFDPSLQFSRPGGWLYYGMASERGIHMALSTDEGQTWEPLGGNMSMDGASGHATHWLDIGRFHDPPIVAGTFADVQAGDDDRVAMSFLGLEGGPGADLDFLQSNQIYQCDERQDELVWHYYVAFSYDAGRSWTIERLSEDPVQVGGIFDSIVSGSGNCRNLLDFNDMDIDSLGRVHIGYADGCVRECAETAGPDTDGYRTSVGHLYRQTGGFGLFAEHDLAVAGTERVNGTADRSGVHGDAEESPALPVLLLGAALLAIATLGRRRP